MAAYRRVDDLWSPAGWLPVHRDQLRAQRSVSSMGSLYLYLFYLGITFIPNQPYGVLHVWEGRTLPALCLCVKDSRGSACGFMWCFSRVSFLVCCLWLNATSTALTTATSTRAALYCSTSNSSDIVRPVRELASLMAQIWLCGSIVTDVSSSDDCGPHSVPSCTV